jgi:hypothetical protein
MWNGWERNARDRREEITERKRKEKGKKEAADEYRKEITLSISTCFFFTLL